MLRQALHHTASPRLRTQLVRRAWIGTGIMGACLAALASFWLYASQTSLKAQAFEAARATAQSLQKAIELDLSHLDGLLAGAELNRQLELRSPRTGAPAEAGGMPAPGQGLLAVGVLDSEGRRIRSATREPIPELPALEREVFGALQASDSTRLTALSLIQLAPPDGTWVLLLGRRRASATGTNEGAVYGLMPAAHFQSLLDSVAVGPQGAIALRHTPSMRLLASQSFGRGDDAQEPIGGSRLSDSFLHALAHRTDTGEFTARTTIDPVERNYVYLGVPDQALMVIAGVATQGYLHLWHLQVLQVMALALLALSVIAWCAWLVYQAWDRESSHVQALARQGQRIQALLQTASDGTHVLDATGTLIEVGDTFLKLLGYRRAELIGRSLSTWLPGFGPRHLQVWSRMLDRRPNLRRETLYRRADGQWICVEIYASKVTIEGQTLVFCSARDMTHRNELEAQLKASNDRAQDLWDNAPCAYHVMDDQGVFLQINATGLRWLQRSNEELIGRRSLADFLEEEGRQAFSGLLDSVRREGRAQDVEVDLHATPNAPQRRLSLSATAIAEGTGAHRQTRTVMYDVTSLHHMKQQLDGLVNEQQAMLDNDLIGIVKLVDRKVVWMNRGLTRIFDFEQSELVGQPIRTLYADEANYLRVGEQGYAELADSGRYRTEIPMRHKNGKVLWIKAFGSYLAGKKGESLWLIEDVTQAHQLFEKIEALAYHDGLTGLPNRRMMTERLEIAIANARRNGLVIGVCFLDLDGFKAVNDQHGHEAGDQLLREIGRRLEQELRPADTVSRTGGDEFVLILNPLAAKPDHEQVLNRILACVRQPIALGNGVEARVGASIGVSFFPDHGHTADMLLRQADQAMYEAKASGRGRICVKALPSPPSAAPVESSRPGDQHPIH